MLHELRRRRALCTVRSCEAHDLQRRSFAVAQ
jgi:hypothetical protein